MSSEYTREFVMIFLPAQFSWIWRMPEKKFHPLKYFPSHRILKTSSQNFTDHLNTIWYRLQVTEATNGFTFQIINSWMESWPGLTVIPPSEICELFWAIFAFTTPFSSCFPGRGTHITRNMCFRGRETHIITYMGYMSRETHFTRDMCFPGRGTQSYH